MADAPKPKLRWYQYSLRSLFLLTLLVAIGMSYVAVTMKNQRKQKAAGREMEKAGARVKSERTWLGNVLRDDSLVRITEVDLFPDSTPDAVLVHLQGLSQLHALSLDNTEVNDATLVHLQRVSQLQYLSLSGTKVTDAGLVHLQGLSQLQALWLERTQVTGAGLANLQGLEQLRHLWLDSSNVADGGLVHLQRLSQLQTLSLDNTRVTDAGLVHLHGMSQLGWLRLGRTKVSDEGVRKLQQALPNCTIDTGTRNKKTATKPRAMSPL
jgi:hypothetical protein